jgi:hypothetical protein
MPNEVQQDSLTYWVRWGYRTGVHAANLDEILPNTTFRHRLQERQAQRLTI